MPASPLSVTVLGLGAMGRRMAARILAAGHPLNVWNRSPGPAAALAAQGAQVADSPRAAVAESDVCISMLTDDQAATEVWLGTHGALEAVRAGGIVVAAGTLRPTMVRELGAAARSRGLHFLDAPVAGSTPQAEAGALRSLVGGRVEEVETVRPVLSTYSSAVVHAGPVGAGATLKLMVNGLFTVQVAAVAELLALARAQGADAAALLDHLAATPVCSPAAAGLGRMMLAGDHAPRFPVRLVEKDLGYVVSAAGGPESAPVAAAARAVFQAHAAAGHGDQNLSVLGLPLP